MQIRPVRLNATIAWLFIIGSSCFALGSVPAYANAVGAQVDAVTYFVGSLFFTSASFCQLVQAQSPHMTEVDARTQHAPAPVVLRAWKPADRNWVAAATQFPGTLFFNVSTLVATVHNLTVATEDRYVWRPDFFGSVLFLISSTYAILALGEWFLAFRPRRLPWWIAWLNMLGSIAFMASAIASYVLPSTGGLVDEPVANAGTFAGAVCFLVGAGLMLPAWRAAVAADAPRG
jgi:hypothetical protein